MPLTTNRFRSPFANIQLDGRADGQVVAVVRKAFCHERAVVAQLRSTASDPSFHLIEKIRLVGGSTAVALKVSPNARASPAGRCRRSRRPAPYSPLDPRSPEAARVVLGRHGVVGILPELVDGIPEGRDDAGGEHEDERDEHQADHERSRGRGGSLGIASGVVARAALQRRRRSMTLASPARSRAAGPDAPRAARAQEDRSAPRPIQTSNAVVLNPGPNRPQEERGEPQEREQNRARDSEAREARLRQRCAFPHGCDRRHPCRTESRPDARHDRDEDSRSQGDDDRGRLQDQPAVRKLKPTASKSQNDAFAAPRRQRARPTTPARR